MKKALVSLCILFIVPQLLFSQQVLLEEDTLINEANSAAINAEQLSYFHNEVKEVRRELYPNIAGKSLMTPTGWGGQRAFLFGAFGGTYPQTYTNDADLVASAGLGIGNANKFLSLVAFINVNDVSAFSNYSGNFILSRRVAKGSSVSAGALHLFSDQHISDAGSSYFIVFSHAIQSLPSKTTGNSKLNYSIGFGSGRFYKKSVKDIESGKGKYGTGVFANVSWELVNSLNLTAEWSGLNLGVALGWRPLPYLPAFNMGFFDLTRFSGSKPRFVFSIAQAFYLSQTGKH